VETEPVALAQDNAEPSAAHLARWHRIALWLVGATLAYNVAEAVIALWAGEQAESISLIGFGLDSVIEVAAALALLWRLSRQWAGADPEALERAEGLVLRFVGGTFIALALYVTADAGWSLYAAAAPAESLVGIALAAASVVIMPLVAWGKLRAARQVRSAALRAEALETLACSYLSAVLLLGLGVHSLLGWWWADPVAALAMVPWLVREGLEGLRGEEDED